MRHAVPAAHRPRLAALAGVAALSCAAFAGDAAAPAIRFTDNHIAYTWEAFGELQVEYPILNRGDGEKQPTARQIDADNHRATLTYDDNLTATVETTPNGQLHITLANAWPNLRTVRVRTYLPKTFAEAGGRYAIGDKTGEIPVERAPQAHIHNGNGPSMILTTAAGASLLIEPMPYTHLEITDNRHWNNDVRMAMFNMPFQANRKSQTLWFISPADAAKPAAVPAPSEGAASVAKAEIPPAKPIDPGAADAATVVTPFKDGKDGAMSLTFDDGMRSHLNNVIPLLVKYDFRGTFFIFPAAGHFTALEARWGKEVAEAGQVFGNHTLTHSGVTPGTIEKEFGETNDIIRRLNPAQEGEPIAFAMPGGLKEGAWAITDQQMNDAFKKYRLLYRGGFTDGRMGAARAVAMAEEAVIQKKFNRIDNHGVADPAKEADKGEWLSVPVGEFEALLKRMDELRERLWVDDLATVLEYMEQRKSAKVDAKLADDTTLTVTVKTDMDPEWYNNPLTLRTRLPAAWKDRRVVMRTAKPGADAGAYERETPAPAAADGVVQYDIVPNTQMIVFKAM